MHSKYRKTGSTDTRRLFLALLPDPTTIRHLARLQEDIKGRKTPLGNLHLTLMFLGNQPESRIPELTAFIDSLAFRAFDFLIDRRGFFSRLKISWAGNGELHPELARLHKAVQDYAIQDAGQAESRKLSFRPHITLARDAKPSDASVPEPFVWHVTRLALMESIISRKPGQSATYRILYEKRAGKAS